MYYNNKFASACKRGDLVQCTELFSTYKIDVDYNRLFSDVCDYNNLELAKWLYDVFPQINVCGNLLFTHACKHGYLDLAKWLINIYPPINLSYALQTAIGWSCKYGHIQVAQWLLTFPQVDIRCDNDYAFINACVNNHIDIVKWLIHLCAQINTTSNIVDVLHGGPIDINIILSLIKKCVDIDLVCVINTCYKCKYIKIIPEIIISFDIIQLDIGHDHQQSFDVMLHKLHYTNTKSARKN